MSIGCNHVRSIKLFTESIHTHCPFMSITCENYDAFKKGKCSQCNHDGHYCIRFGFHSRSSYQSVLKKRLYDDNEPIATYLMTTGKEPFCAAHYKITVKISESEESRLHGGEIGSLFIKLKSENVETSKILFNPIPVFFSPGSNHTFLTIGDHVESIDTIKVEYQFKQTFNPLTWRIFTPRIYVESIMIESMEHNFFIKLCPHHGLPVSQDQGILFKESSCDYKKNSI